ncbi:MAG: zinc dependent phospholipase C family protein [Bacteroidota bacterium]
MKLNKTFIFLSVFLITSFSNAYASKVDLHIWIGQQIINDLEDDGQLSFSIGGKVKLIKVKDEVRRAILGNRQYFLMGNIGPDALPGIYSGQMTIHPGSDNDGWGTGDWLAHLLNNAKSEQEIAFVYGYACHAASDVFAHTYVNQYAGDCFKLTDGETLVEERHFLLEGYISEFLPKMLNYQGNYLGTPANNIKIGDELAIPVDFLWRVFIQDEKAIEEFGKNGSIHLLAVHNLYNELGSLAKDGGVLDEIHILVEQIVAYYVFNISLSKEDLEKINVERQKIMNYGNYAIDGAQTVERDVKEMVLSINKLKNDRINKKLEELGNVLKKWTELQKEKQKIENEILETHKKLSDTRQQICGEVIDELCKWICLVHKPWPLEGCAVNGWGDCKKVAKQICKLNPEYVVLETTLKAKQQTENTVNSNINNTSEEFKKIVSEIHSTSENIIKTEIELSQSAINLLQRFATNENPLKSIILQWRKDIKIAMEEYFKANGTAIHNSIANQDIIEPLIKWKSCWMPAILGIPSEVSNGICTTKDVVVEIKDLLNKVEEAAANQDPILKEVIKLRKKVEETLMTVAKKELYNLGENLTGVEIERIVNVLKEKPTKETINNAFSSSDNSKSLLVISNAAQRIDSEMNIDSGYFNPLKFNMVYNSIVLSKMSILDFNGLNTLIGKKLYTEGDTSSINVMVRLASSIDGNHHWLPESPPFIRADGNILYKSKSGYDEGFIIWQNKKVRNKIFRKIFHGPLNPALETPEKYGFEKIIPESYPYKPTEKCPFPNFPGNPECK